MILKARKKRKIRVLVFGVFDGLHPGHVYFLRAARRYGNELTVVVTPDSRVLREKGRMPHFRQDERMALLAALRLVDHVVLGDGGKRWKAVEKLRPDVICAGHDQRTDDPAYLRQLARMWYQPQMVVLPAFHRERFASSKKSPKK